MTPLTRKEQMALAIMQAILIHPPDFTPNQNKITCGHDLKVIAEMYADMAEFYAQTLIDRLDRKKRMNRKKK